MKFQFHLLLMTILLFGGFQLNGSESLNQNPKLEEAFNSSVILHITKEIPEEIPDVVDKRGRITKKGGVVYHQVEVMCSANYITPNHLLTNRHCVERSVDISAETADGEFRQAETIYISPKADLALIYTKKENDTWLQIAETNPAVGEVSFAYGHPFGIAFTLTRGIVAKVSPSGNYLLLDQTVLPGNSGSALLNTSGELIGVCNALFNSNPFVLSPSGLSGAVSASAVHEFLKIVGIEPDERIFIRREEF